MERVAWLPALPPERLERGRKEKGCPTGSQLEGRGALGHGQEGVRWWPWDTRLGKHPSPGKGMRGKGLCVLRLQTRTCWELREPPGQVGRAPGPSLPPHLTPVPPRLKHTEKEVLSGLGSWGPNSQDRGSCSIHLTAGPSETWGRRLHKVTSRDWHMGAQRPSEGD